MTMKYLRNIVLAAAFGTAWNSYHGTSFPEEKLVLEITRQSERGKNGKVLLSYSIEPGVYRVHTNTGDICEPICEIDSKKHRIRISETKEKLVDKVLSPKILNAKYQDSMKLMNADLIANNSENWFELRPGVYQIFAETEEGKKYLGGIDTRGIRINVYKIEDNQRFKNIPVLNP